MSTRATYEFHGDYIGTHFIYIHYDGYPEGAAMYFNNMLEYKDNNKNFGERDMASNFIRANGYAELTNGHHGDTEYHYYLYVDTMICKAFKRDWNNPEGFDRNNPLFIGKLQDFINQNNSLIKNELFELSDEKS